MCDKQRTYSIHQSEDKQRAEAMFQLVQKPEQTYAFSYWLLRTSLTKYQDTPLNE